MGTFKYMPNFPLPCVKMDESIILFVLGFELAAKVAKIRVEKTTIALNGSIMQVKLLLRSLFGSSIYVSVQCHWKLYGTSITSWFFCVHSDQCQTLSIHMWNFLKKSYLLKKLCAHWLDRLIPCIAQEIKKQISRIPRKIRKTDKFRKNLSYNIWDLHVVCR